MNEPAHILPDNRACLITNDATRLLVNVSEPPRLMVNDTTRILSNDNRLLGNDGRLLGAGVNDGGNRLVDNRHLTVVEGGRLIATDKYLTGYDPYHRGHL